LLLGIIGFFTIMGLTVGSRMQLSIAEKFVKDTVSWTQGIFYRPAAYVAGLFEEIGHIRNVYVENQSLREALTQYVLDTQRLNELEIQNENLKKALDFTERQKQSQNYVYRIAEIISVHLDPYNESISINLGEVDGIKENMTVVSVDGLIGRIDKVSNFYSSVHLIENINDVDYTSKAISATVKGKESQSYGMIESVDKKTGFLVMNRIDQSDPLALGDLVITSGLGKIFPAGIEIGYVMSLGTGEFGITRQALIQPKASSKHLREVFVIEIPEAR
jgi:rod shape-determining protein MreC